MLLQWYIHVVLYIGYLLYAICCYNGTFTFVLYIGYLLYAICFLVNIDARCNASICELKIS